MFSSAPSIRGKLPLKYASAAVREVAEVSTAKRITVSGGEPFLDLEYLFTLAHDARSVGLAFRVATNGSFGRDRQAAEKAIGELSRIGVEAVGISWDQYHSQFIEPDHVRTAISTCRKFGVSVRLTIVVSQASKLANALDLLGDEAFELPITQVKCLPVGRAEKKVRSNDLLPAASTDVGRACRNDFDTLSLTPNGDVYPCCAVGGFTDGIRLGRFPDEPLRTLLNRRDYDLFWVVLAAQGPKFFIERMTEVERTTLGIAAGANLHDCVMCNRLFRSPLGIEIATRVVTDLKNHAVRISEAMGPVD